MAVFEHKNARVKLDDTVPLKCTVESAQTIAGHTEYLMRVQRGPVVENNWTVTRRYKDFVNLDALLKISGFELPLPPKKVFGNMEREFIAERQQGLNVYMEELLKHWMLASSEPVKRFLDPNNYSHNLQEAALQHISMFFRSEPKWEVVEPWPDIGWRLRKRYFLIKDSTQAKEKLLLSWCLFGPDKFLGDRELMSIMKLLPTFRHPHLYPSIFAMSNEKSGITIRTFMERGSLRDVLCKSKPQMPYLKKYANPKAVVACSMQGVQLYGKQILETLTFLHEKGIPYGQLHCGNLVVEDNRIMLLDIENGLLGVPSCYRHFFTQIKKIQKLEAVDVYCFGQTLFEMVFGHPLNAPTCDTLPPQCQQELASLLKSILSTEACKNGMPSIADLLAHPFFDVSAPVMEKPQVKIPSKLKEALKDARDSMEKRLKEEQKLNNQFRRMSKVQAFHSSEEEKKKRRKKKKQQQLRNGEADAGGSGDRNSQASPTPLSPTSPTSPTSPITPTSMSPTPTPPPPPGPPPPTQNAPVAPPAPPPPSNQAPAASGGAAGTDRGALLSSINNFSKAGLKHCRTVDKSKPKIR